MSIIEDAEFDVLKDQLIEKLDDFMDSIEPDQQTLALECIQSWLDGKMEVF